MANGRAQEYPGCSLLECGLVLSWGGFCLLLAVLSGGACQSGLIDKPVRGVDGDDVATPADGGDSPTCVGESTEPCAISNGSGARSRTCVEGVWSDWSNCAPVSCLDGYRIDGNACVPEEPQPSNTKEILGFEIDGVVGIVGTNTVSLTLPFGTDLTNLVPIIEHNGASLEPASLVPQDFSSPVTYTVTAEDNSTKAYVVTVNEAPPTGDVFYIDPLGDDAGGVGSYDDPWRSLAHACSQVDEPGALIFVREGNYPETARCALAVGVSIVGEGIGSHLVMTYAPTSLSDGAIWLGSPSPNPVDGNQSISRLFIDGNATTGTRAMAVNFRSNVEIHHCTFMDFKYSGIRFDGTASNWNVEPTNTLPTGNEVHDCTFINCTQYADNSGVGHIRPEGQAGMKIFNNIFVQTSRVLTENADILAGFWNEGLQIFNNQFTRNDFEGGQWNFFAELHYSQGGFELYGNTFNGAACFDYSGSVKGDYAFGARIFDNRFLTAAPPPVDGHRQAYLDLESFDYENDIYIYRNFFLNSRIGVHINNIQTSGDTFWIYDNIFENVGNAVDNYSYGIMIGSFWADDTEIPLSNIHIYNNVIDAGTSAYAGIIFDVCGDITNVSIKNNIIHDNFSYPIRFGSRCTAPRVDTLAINNNIFWHTGTTTIYYHTGNTYVGRDDSGNLVVDPGFVGGSPFDFHLASTSSPAYHAGVTVGLDADYDGVVWHSPPSIGAFEYVE